MLAKLFVNNMFRGIYVMIRRADHEGVSDDDEENIEVEAGFSIGVWADLSVRMRVQILFPMTKN